MAQEGRDTAATFSGNLISAVLVLGTQGCLAWLLGPDGRGEYATCLVFSGLLTLIFGLGVDMGIIHHLGSKQLKISEAVPAGLLWCIISSVPAMIIGTLLLELDYSFFLKAPYSAFFLSLFLVPLNLVVLVYTRVLIGLGELVTFSLLTVVRSALVLLATVLLLLLTDLEVHGALAALFIGDFLLCLSIHILLSKAHGLEPSLPNRNAMGLLASFAVRFYFGKVGRGFNFQMGTLLLGFLGTKAEVGFFATAMAIMSRVWMVPDTINLVLLPRTTSERSGRADLVARSCRISAIVVLFISVVLVVLARPMVLIVFSQAFLPIVPLMWILAVGVIIRSHQRVLASYFNGLGRPGLYSIGILAGLAVNAISIPFLYRWLGLKGAALSMAFSYLVETLVVSYWFVKISNQPFSSLWRLERSDWPKLIQIFGYFRQVFSPQRSQQR